MSELIAVWKCDCGSIAKSDGIMDGYPAYQCIVCHKRWWTTRCFRSSKHVIDSRRAKKCDECSFYHCPVCNACNPKGNCHCDGTCKPAA